MYNPLANLFNLKNKVLLFKTSIYLGYYILIIVIILACLSYGGQLLTASNSIANLFGILLYLVAVLGIYDLILASITIIKDTIEHFNNLKEK